MAGGWGSAKNKIRIGVFWDGIQLSADGSQARITDPRVTIDRGVNIIDSSNRLEVSGGAVVDGTWSNLNLDGSGEKRIKNVSGQWQNLAYGKTTTVSFQAELSGVNYAGATLTVSKSVTLPARAFTAPATQSDVVATRITDTQATIAWTRNVTTGGPYSTQYVERSTDGGAYVQIAALSGDATNYIDPGIQPNHIYAWRVRAQNGAGVSGYAGSGTIYTTPATPIAGTIAKAGSTIIFGWISTSPYATGYRVYHRSGTGPYTLLGVVSAGPYIHSNVNTAVTHQYKVTAGIGNLESDALESDVVQLLAPPLAATVTTEDVEDLAGADLDIYWTHNPVDSTAQTNAAIRYRKVGETAWTTVGGLLTDDSYTIRAGTLANGAIWEIQVQTKGGHADPSPWSASALVKGSAAPSVTIISPDPEVGTAIITAQWAYHDPEGTAQSAWRVQLRDSGGDLGVWSGAGAATSYTIPYQLANLTTYALEIRVWDGDGMASALELREFATEFLTPPAPGVTAIFNQDDGSVEISITVPEPSTDEVAAVRIQAFRDGVMIADVDAAPTITLVDRIPPLNAEPIYTAVAWSQTPTSATSDPEPVDTGSWWVMLNGGEGWDVMARVLGNPAIDMAVGREKVLHRFAGRTKPIEYTGEARTRVLKLAGTVAGLGIRTERGTWQPFEALADLPAPICYRDPLGRRLFVSIGDITIRHAATSDQAAVSCTLTEVDHAE